MKKILMLVVLALALPLAAFASNSVDFSNSGGILAGTSSGLSLTGSTLVAVNGYEGNGLITGSNLGSLTFSTAALATGSLKMGGTFDPGGSFTITSNGSTGLPNGVLFSGTFSSATWTLLTLPNGTHKYTLTGVLTGAFASGYNTNGVRPIDHQHRQRLLQRPHPHFQRLHHRRGSRAWFAGLARNRPAGSSWRDPLQDQTQLIHFLPSIPNPAAPHLCDLFFKPPLAHSAGENPASPR